MGLITDGPTMGEVQCQLAAHLERGKGTYPVTDLDFGGPWGRRLLVHLDSAVKLTLKRDDFVGPCPGRADTREPEVLGRALVHELLKRTDMRGADIRLTSGVPFRFRAWPKAAVQSNLWDWSTTRSFPFTYQQHINELELLVILHYAR